MLCPAASEGLQYLTNYTSSPNEHLQHLSVLLLTVAELVKQSVFQNQFIRGWWETVKYHFLA